MIVYGNLKINTLKNHNVTPKFVNHDLYLTIRNNQFYK